MGHSLPDVFAFCQWPVRITHLTLEHSTYSLFSLLRSKYTYESIHKARGADKVSDGLLSPL